MKNEPASRKLKISILRFNPQEPNSVPRMQTYEIDEAENMTLFIALSEIREKQDPSLQFEFSVRGPDRRPHAGEVERGFGRTQRHFVSRRNTRRDTGLAARGGFGSQGWSHRPFHCGG